MPSLHHSHHSSNPCEVGSSDFRNALYNRKLKNAAATDITDSDDPLAESYDIPEEQAHMMEYHRHVANLVVPRLGSSSHFLPGFSGARSNIKTRSILDLVNDEDHEMGSDPMERNYEEDDAQRVQSHKDVVEDDDDEDKHIEEDEEGHTEEGHSDGDENNDADHHDHDMDNDLTVTLPAEELYFLNQLQKQQQEEQADNEQREVDLIEDGMNQLDTDEEMGILHSDEDSDEEHQPEQEEEEQVSSDEELDDLTDEENTIHDKDSEEQDEILIEIAELEASLPQLRSDYHIVDRLGTGTFSSVYKAIDIGYHEKWDNTPWHGHHPYSSSAHYQSRRHPRGTKVYVAIKRIYVTSSPERIRNELVIMEECRGCRHVSQIITAYRELDQVAVVMPYHRNDDFRDFYRTLSMEGIKSYFRCMFRALRDIHERMIIHRDVKPANFLFDPRTGVGTLCDFGLASRMEKGPVLGSCLHTGTLLGFPHGKLKSKKEYDSEDVMARQREARNMCTLPAEKVGYPDKDMRPVSKANRAGTRGFRAPEVLLKCGDQTGAIDVWAVGIILLFFLTGKFPLFQSNDDIEALMEIATIIGKKRMEKTATLHNRIFVTNVPSVTNEGVSWRSFVERLNPNLYQPREPDLHWYPHNTAAYRERLAAKSASHPSASGSSSPTDSLGFPTSPSAADSPATTTPESNQHLHDIEAAFDLLDKLMAEESVKRLTPKDALSHPFLREDDDDDEHADCDFRHVPHPFGHRQSVCAPLHFRDEVTERPFVKVEAVCECGECDGTTTYPEVRELVAGEGIAIGNEPCEFHPGVYIERGNT